MGRSMAGHLLDAGHDVHVYSRTEAKAAELVKRGATWHPDVAGVAARVEIVFTMVGFPADAEKVYFGPAGLLAGQPSFRICVDMGTTPPALARRIAEAAAARGIRALDAPVSGGDIGAREARLAIMVGGDRAAFDEVLPLFQKMGRSISHLGGPGAGQHTKVCNQVCAAGTMLGLSEALYYAVRQGLAPEEVIRIVETGAAASWALSNLGPRIVRGDFAPGFYVEHFIKDLGIALAEARALNLQLPGTALAHALYERARALGYERNGTQVLIKVLEDLAREAGAGGQVAARAGS